MASEVKQYWKVNVVNDNPTFPFLVFDNWYTPGEEKAVWKELDFYSAYPKDAIKRAEAYSKAGADAILIHSKEKNPSQVFSFAKKFLKSKYFK
ncbi:MAG: hypothetical protein VW298_02540, partial [Candidatus Woesearchaeota archaeon]